MINTTLEIVEKELNRYGIELKTGFNPYEERMYHFSEDEAIGVINTYHGEVTYTPTMNKVLDLRTRLLIYQLIEDFQKNFN